MKTFFVLAACAAGLCGADIVVDDGETVDLSVAGDAVQTEPVWFAAEAGKVEKSGAGAWTLAVSNLATSASAVVAVREGALNLVGGAPGDVSVPSNVLGRAALWFDAAKADTRVEGTSALNTGVATWYDARETREADGSWGARHFCATARTSWLTNEVAEGVWEKAVLHPVARTFADAPALSYVHFNGRQSGSWMGFCEPGSRKARTANIGEIRHLFYSGYVENAWGYPMGSLSLVFWHPQLTDGALGLYASANSMNPGVFQGRSLLNGAVFDEAAVKVEPGPYVYEWDAGDVAGFLGNFFNDRNIWSAQYRRAGGDALGEVVVFTNRLSALEREQVAAYLLRKWRPAAPGPAVEVRTARGAEVTVADDAAQTVTGAGTLRLAEEGRVQAYSMTEPFAGSTRVEASATLVAGEPQLALHAGDAYTVTRDLYDGLGFANAPDAAKAAAGEAHLDLAADVAVRVASLPETIKTLAVSGAGELVLAAPPPVGKGVAAVTGDVYATMPNADMEDWTGTGEKKLSLGQTTDHWKLVSAVYPNQYFLNLTSLYGEGGKGHWMLDGGKKDAFRPVDYPFQGNVVMALKQGCVVENTVTFPADGDYELTFLTGGRMDSAAGSVAGGWVKLALVDGAGAEAPIGTAFGYVGTSMRKQRFLVRGVRAGTYTFRLDHAVGTGDAHTVLDDFRFRLVTDLSSETVVYPPNADFEQVDMAWDGRYARDAGHTAADWTLAQSEETGTEPDVCLVTRGMTNVGYRAGSARGGVQLAFYGNAGSATSAAFTLPAGTWKLRLRAASFQNTEGSTCKWNGRSPNRANGLAGELLDGGAVRPLGALASVDKARMTRVTLPEAVTLDAPRTVRLRLRGTAASAGTTTSCAILDELELVRQDAGGELVTNGTFAEKTDWTLRSNLDTSTAVFSNSTAKSRAYISDPCRLVGSSGGAQQAYGNTYGVSRLALDICQCGSAEQALAFPVAGTYRLAFSARSRLWIYENALPSRNYGGNQALFYLVDAQGATNEIFRTPSLYASNFVFRSTLFNVPAAGTYTFGIRGLNGLPLPNGTTLQVGANPSDTEFFIDQVSVRPAPDAPLEIDDALMLDLRNAARLRLDFTGTNEVERLRLGGVPVAGYVDASHPSGLVCGTGCLYVRPKGTVLLLR